MNKSQICKINAVTVPNDPQHTVYIRDPPNIHLQNIQYLAENDKIMQVQPIQFCPKTI